MLGRHVELDSDTGWVTDISFATGFGSLGGFRRQFATTGTTPNAYRTTFRAARQARPAVSPR